MQTIIRVVLGLVIMFQEATLQMYQTHLKLGVWLGSEQLISVFKYLLMIQHFGLGQNGAAVGIIGKR